MNECLAQIPNDNPVFLCVEFHIHKKSYEPWIQGHPMEALVIMMRRRKCNMW